MAEAPRLIVAINAFSLLVTLLRFHREGRDRACFQSTQRDRFAGLLAKTVGAVVDARKRLIDFGNQLALAVARAQLDGPVSLR